MTTLAFSITSKCVETCPHCFRSPQRDTSIKEFEGILSRTLRDAPELSKIVITGGDPELNKDFWEICKEVKKKGLKLKIHGNYSNKNNWIKYAKIADEVSIPIDSLFTKQPFRSTKSAQNFRKAFDYFLKKNVGVQVHTIVGKPNLKDTTEISDFLKSKGFFLPGPNSWKLFRLVQLNDQKEPSANNQKELELTDKEWFEVKKRFAGKNTKFVDNVIEY